MLGELLELSILVQEETSCLGFNSLSHGNSVAAAQFSFNRLLLSY